MTTRKGSGAVLIRNDARLLKILLGSGNVSEAKASPRKNQITTRAEFSRDLTAALGPRLARPGWTRFVLSGDA